MRKLVTVQTITDLQPIKDADRIEAARVLGWTVVVGKGEFSVGDKVAYFEIDSFLPGTNPNYETFMARGVKTVAIDGKDVQGHVLKTAKLRGVVSQGLILPLSKLGVEASVEVGTDISDVAGVVKWEPPLPMGNGDIVGPFSTRFAPKTDAIRLQNLVDVWDALKTVDWEPTLKVDGTSQTLVRENDTVRIYGRNWELSTDKAAGFKIAERSELVTALEPGMAIQFELVGPGIQANRLKLQTQQAIVFAVWQDGNKLSRSEWPAAALAHATPVLGQEFSPKNFSTPDELIAFVDGLRGSYTKDVLDEGVVFHPVEPTNLPSELSTVLDRNGNFKVISNKWLLKGGD